LDSKNRGISVLGGEGRESDDRQFWAAAFEELYERFNHREFVSPDPLQFLYEYPKPEDREIVGLVASALAYGRVSQILRSVSAVLEHLGPSPGQYLREVPFRSLRRSLRGFRHRFAGGEDVARLFFGAACLVRRFGSLRACFEAGLSDEDETILPALSRFVDSLLAAAGGPVGHLLPRPAERSACKRLNLYLRWMVRRDEVDPGGWDSIPPRKLIVPLDTHMYHIGRVLGMTSRKSADMKAALEITAAFRRVAPDDPVRYDFALTRLGIRPDLEMERFLRDLSSAARRSAYA